MKNMKPKISIFTTLGNVGNAPDYWQYAWREAIQSYLDFADEVVIVSGMDGKQDVEEMLGLILDTNDVEEKKIKFVNLPWPYDFSWPDIAKHFNAGLEACTGDWVMKMDIDYVIHENDMEDLRHQLGIYIHENWMACSFVKFTVLAKDKAYQKVHIPFILNRYSAPKSIKFGIATDADTAWGYPIMATDIDSKTGLPVGRQLPPGVVRPTGINIWNYDNTFRDIERTKEHFLRFSKARAEAGFGWDWGKDENEALKVFCRMMRSRLSKLTKPLSPTAHPKYMRERIANMTPEQFGYNAWDNFKGILD